MTITNKYITVILLSLFNKLIKIKLKLKQTEKYKYWIKPVNIKIM
jgi:hypothetical protein